MNEDSYALSASHMVAWHIDNILLKDCDIWYTTFGNPLLNIISAPIMSSDVATCLLFLQK